MNLRLNLGLATFALLLPLAACSSPATVSDSPSASTAGSSSPGASTPGSSSSAGPITMSEVSKHNTAADCWAVVNKNVYNLTEWINAHPGGKDAIISLCGTDGTAAFTGQHEGQGRPEQQLATFLLGPLG